jgi:hypothetical protein
MQTRRPLQSISYRSSQQNPAYATLFSSMHQEQASRIIQGAWRAWHKITFKSSYTETLTGALSLNFIREPHGLMAKQHGMLLEAGNWLGVNYAEPEFVRNAFKAFRLGYITKENTLATALLLHAAKTQYRSAHPTHIKQYRFDEAGPYDFTSITYANADNQVDFRNRLDTLSKGDQCYFSVNLSREEEAGFLYEGLALRKLHEVQSPAVQKDFANIIGHYLQKHGIQPSMQEQIVSDIISDNLAQRQQATNKVLKEISHLEVASLPFIALTGSSPASTAKQNRMSLSLLINIYGVGEQLPSVTISPDFDQNNPDSPLLCLILPTTSALIELQRAMHGADTTAPFFTVGQISPSSLRVMDEFPSRLKRTGQMRGVELIHPDVLESQQLHGAKINPLIAIYHDLFHCWRNGSNPYKATFRHIRQLLESEKKFFASKSIWDLTDMDTAIGWLMRNAEKNGAAAQIQQTKNYCFYKLLSLTSPDFFTNIHHHDNSLLLLIDMIKHSQKWSVFAKQIVLFFQQYSFPEMMDGFDLPFTFEMKTAYREMKSILTEDNESKNQQTEFSTKSTILRYRLRKHAKGLNLCEQLDALGVDNLLSWHRNGGLYLIDLPGVTLSALKPEELYEQISMAVTLYNRRIANQKTIFNHRFMTFFYREHITATLKIQHGDKTITTFSHLTDAQRIRLLELRQLIDPTDQTSSVFKKEEGTLNHRIDLDWFIQLNKHDPQKVAEFAETIGLPENIFRARIKLPINLEAGYRPKR